MREEEEFYVSLPTNNTLTSKVSVFVISESSFGFQEWEDFQLLKEQGKVSLKDSLLPYRYCTSKFPDIEFCIVEVEFDSKNTSALSSVLHERLNSLKGEGKTQVLICLSVCIYSLRLMIRML